MNINRFDIETLAFEGINVYFNFLENKPKFGDVFLITGFEHPKFKPTINDFESLSEFEFDQVDDFFGIPNETEIGDDVKIWLFPTIKGDEVFHHEGPFDGIKITYDVLRNPEEVEILFKSVFNKIVSEISLPIEIVFENETITSFNDLQPIIDKVKEHCKTKLNVTPGSSDALQLDY